MENEDLQPVFVSKFLKIYDITHRFKERKTAVYVVTGQTGAALARILWHGPWRRYIFEPYHDTIYDSNCLKDIIKFIDELMDKRKNG